LFGRSTIHQATTGALITVNSLSQLPNNSQTNEPAGLFQRDWIRVSRQEDESQARRRVRAREF
jgi:hypothetical protein